MSGNFSVLFPTVVEDPVVIMEKMPAREWEWELAVFIIFKFWPSQICRTLLSGLSLHLSQVSLCLYLLSPYLSPHRYMSSWLPCDLSYPEGSRKSFCCLEVRFGLLGCFSLPSSVFMNGIFSTDYAGKKGYLSAVNTLWSISQNICKN